MPGVAEVDVGGGGLAYTGEVEDEGGAVHHRLTRVTHTPTLQHRPQTAVDHRVSERVTQLSLKTPPAVQCSLQAPLIDPYTASHAMQNRIRPLP